MSKLGIVSLALFGALSACATATEDFVSGKHDSGRTDASVDSDMNGTSETSVDASAVEETMVDSGAADTGSASTDTGSAPIDTGTIEVDTGTVVVDTGTAPVDTGMVVMDTSTPCVVVDGFESGSLSGWSAADTGTPATVVAGAAHDGSYGFKDGMSASPWYLRTTPSIGKPGDKLTAWVRGTTGRVYLGFSATTAGAKSFVFAPNTSEIRFQDNPSWGYTELNSAPLTSGSGWYKMEVVFGASGMVTGNLYDADGTTLRATISRTYAGLTAGGIALRSFNSMNVDTITFCAAP